MTPWKREETSPPPISAVAVSFEARCWRNALDFNIENMVKPCFLLGKLHNYAQIVVFVVLPLLTTTFLLFLIFLFLDWKNRFPGLKGRPRGNFGVQNPMLMFKIREETKMLRFGKNIKHFLFISCLLSFLKGSDYSAYRMCTYMTVSQNSGPVLRRNWPPNEKPLYTRVTL